MSDYISKSALIDMIVNKPSTNIPRCPSTIFRKGYYNGKVERQHEIIDIIDALPTLSETEIIRKAFERIASRIQQVIWDSCSSDEYKYASEEIEKIFNEVCVEEGDINE